MGQQTVAGLTVHLRDAVEVVRGVGCRRCAADADGGQLEAGRVLNATGDGSDGVTLSGASEVLATVTAATFRVALADGQV